MKSSLSAFLRGGILWVALGLVGLPGKSFGQVLVSFGFTGAEQTWVVPSGINSIRIDAGGGGGGGGLSKLGSGGGGATSIFYRLGSGDTLWVVAGGGGGYGAGGGGYSGSGYTGGGGVAGQEAVIAWQRTVLFPRWGVQVVADNHKVVMVETVLWLGELLR